MFPNLFTKSLNNGVYILILVYLISSCNGLDQPDSKIVSTTSDLLPVSTLIPCESRESPCTATKKPVKILITATSSPTGKNNLPLSATVQLRTSTPGKPSDQTPTSTPLLPTPTMHWMTDPNEYLGKLVKMEHKADVIYLKDLQTGGVREIQLDYLQFLGWAHEGCGLYLRMFDRNIIEIDLRGNIRQTVFDSSKWKERGFEKEAEWVELSPSEQWGAYVSGEGTRKEYPVYGYHYENEDLLVMSADGHLGPYKVSHHRGAWLFGWSPDSTSIVYLDRDENGVQQLFISQYDGSQSVQITHFTDHELYIEGFFWSPNGQFFNFFLEYPDNKYDVYLVRASDGFLIDLRKYTKKDPLLIWDDDLLGIWGDQTIDWIEPVTGTHIRTDVVSQSSESMWSFGSEKLFYFYDRYNQWNIFLFDLYTNTQVLLTDPHIEYELNYSFIPDSFPGEKDCKWP